MNLSQMERAMSHLEDEYDNGSTLSNRIKDARQYVDNHLYRAEVVPQIPAVGEAGHFYVTAGDTNLYVGTGTGMRRIATQAVP